jgi:hypothetical protein
MAVTSPGGPQRAVLVGAGTNDAPTGVTTGAARSPVPVAGFVYHVVYVKATAALSAGTLVIDERDQPGDVPGAIATLNLASIFSGGGGTYAYHLPVSAYGYLSAHIGTTVVDGLVSAVLRSA